MEGRPSWSAVWRDPMPSDASTPTSFQLPPLGLALTGTDRRKRFAEHISSGRVAEFMKDIADRHPSRAERYRSKPTLFLSYARKDFRRLSRHLKGISIGTGGYFLDQEHLRAGEHWSDRLLDEIEKRDVFCLFWSAAAAESDYVRKEYEHALSLGKEIYPYRFKGGDVHIPSVLSRFHFEVL